MDATGTDDHAYAEDHGILIIHKRVDGLGVRRSEETQHAAQAAQALLVMALHPLRRGTSQPCMEL
jgi:hypothetical protein